MNTSLAAVQGKDNGGGEMNLKMTRDTTPWERKKTGQAGLEIKQSRGDGRQAGKKCNRVRTKETGVTGGGCGSHSILLEQELKLKALQDSCKWCMLEYMMVKERRERLRKRLHMIVRRISPTLIACTGTVCLAFLASSLGDQTS
ncbi:hypothetical protein BDQ17DRAFT_1334904 [Cyathus striatus]|nr:hypothetical protein BDQ17DRAFT_1334904 [Cyathus striatus]